MKLRPFLSHSLVGCAVFAAVFAGSAAAAGEALQVSVPKHLQVNVAYTITISGSTPSAERLYLFVDYHRCGPNPAVEHARANGGYARVNGSFQKRSSGWKSSSPGLDHVCTYLQALSTPVNGAGGVLKHAFLTYRIH